MDKISCFYIRYESFSKGPYARQVYNWKEERKRERKERQTNIDIRLILLLAKKFVMILIKVVGQKFNDYNN